MELSIRIKALIIIGIIVGASIGIGVGVYLWESRTPSARLGALSGDLHHLPLFVALEQNFFADEGLDINFEDIRWFPNGNEVMIAFEAGSLDIAYLGLAPAMSFKLKLNTPIKVVSGVNVNGSAIIVGASSNITTLADLAGKKIAIPSLNNMQDFILQVALSKVGLGTGDVQRVTLAVGNMENALNTAQIEAFVAWEPFNAKAIYNIGAYSLMNSSEIWANHPCCIIAASDDFLNSQGTIVEKIVQVHKRALQWMALPENHAGLVAIAKKYTSITADSIIDLAVDNVGYIFNFTAAMPEIERFYDNLTALNPTNAPPWPSGRAAFIQEFFNDTFLGA